ncbi:MAG: HAD family hydrolase [Lachnospiraceae bacterium]|nr:HAD family hydrolase [Lachnospiraceae bacterium]
MNEKKTGILLDIDGTLWDSSTVVAESYQEMMDRHPEVGGACTRDDIMHVMGKTMTEIEGILFPQLAPEERHLFMKKCEDYEIEYLLTHPVEPFPGVVDTLRALSKDFPLFIVSNCQKGYIEAFIEITGLSDIILDHISFGDNLLPKGDNIRLIAERNGLERYFYLGDIQSDYDATIAGGGEFIHAAYGFGTIRQSVPKIHDIRELPALMKELAKS